MKTKNRFLISFFILVITLQSAAAKNLYGFKLLKTAKYTQSTQVLLYEHQKTGAQIVWLKNEDTDRAFNIAFNTRAYDDVGLPHIFEHSCLAGSEKYPSSNLFFQMGSQTFNTFMNAMTYQLFTCYPMSSLSEEQLFASLDVYMNGVFHPIVLTQENDLKREAVRFVLNSPDDKISATGAVYNELLGSMSDKGIVNHYNLLKVLFPESTNSYITGGNPDDILNVSWQSVKDFHQKYYQPSNMVIYLYGKLDCNRFLEYFDREFLSHYERTETDLTDFYQSWEGEREALVEFPASKDANTHNASIFNYAFTLPDSDFQTYNDLRIFDNYVSLESSWLSQKLKEKFPSAEFYCGFNYLNEHPYFQFEVENINEEDKDELKAIFTEAVELFCSEELDKKYIEIFANNLKMSTILDEENPNGVSELRSAALFWAASGNSLHFIDNRNRILNLPKTSTPQTVLSTVKKYLVSPKQSVVMITKPVAGLSEIRAAQKDKYFADKKASMTKEEIDSLIQENKDYEAWLSENEKINLIDKVKVVTAKNLPEESKDVEISDTTQDGIRYLIGENKGLEYVSANLKFDLHSLPKKYLHPVMLYFALLESLPTKNFTLEELEAFEMQCIYNSSFYTTFFKYDDELATGGSAFYSCASFSCLNEKLADTLKITEEILLNTELSDYDTIRSWAGKLEKSKRQGSTDNPNGIAAEISFVAANPAYTARLYATRYEYWDFLKRVSKMTDEEIEVLTNEIKEGLKFVLNKNNMILSCIGDKKQIDKCVRFTKSLAEKLSDEKLETQNVFGEHEPLPKKIAVIVPGTSNYNFKEVSISKLGVPFSAKYVVLGSMLDDMYLFSNLRYKFGAYGAGSNFSKSGLIFYSFRDPNIQNTFSVFSGAADAVENLKVSDSDLEGYITSIYSSLMEKASLSSRYEHKFYKILSHDYEKNSDLRMMKEVKATTSEDLKEYAALLRKLDKDGSCVTVGSAEQIYASKDDFDLIITEYIK